MPMGWGIAKHFENICDIPGDGLTSIPSGCGFDWSVKVFVTFLQDVDWRAWGRRGAEGEGRKDAGPGEPCRGGRQTGAHGECQTRPPRIPLAALKPLQPLLVQKALLAYIMVTPGVARLKRTQNTSLWRCCDRWKAHSGSQFFKKKRLRGRHAGSSNSDAPFSNRGCLPLSFSKMSYRTLGRRCPLQTKLHGVMESFKCKTMFLIFCRKHVLWCTFFGCIRAGSSKRSYRSSRISTSSREALQRHSVLTHTSMW